MNNCIEKLKAFLAEQSPCFGYDDANSILEMLYYYYTTANPVDNAVIRCQFRDLDNTLSHLTLAENDAIFSLTCNLCTAYERQAFSDGVQVGLRLFTELCDLLEVDFSA